MFIWCISIAEVRQLPLGTGAIDKPPLHANSANISDVCMDSCHCFYFTHFESTHCWFLYIWYVCHTLPFIQIFECNKHFSPYEMIFTFSRAWLHNCPSSSCSMQYSHIFFSVALVRWILIAIIVRYNATTNICRLLVVQTRYLVDFAMRVCALNSRNSSSPTICNANKCVRSARISNLGDRRNNVLFEFHFRQPSRLCRWGRLRPY